ncbi:hypothetical protein LBMAG52_13370 [Planctomycetia bacterium]|nr:hypothetical protein LBMAG52_13370 [Planctomycetia bacterium]
MTRFGQPRLPKFTRKVGSRRLDGVVLSGSLEKLTSTPVETGQVLFEIAPLDRASSQLLGSSPLATVRIAESPRPLGHWLLERGERWLTVKRERWPGPNSRNSPC